MSDEQDAPSAPRQADELKKKTARTKTPAPNQTVPEIGGPTGPEPTRYGDWERKGRVSDF